MVSALLQLNQLPPSGAADALAVAICHANTFTIASSICPRQIRVKYEWEKEDYANLELNQLTKRVFLFFIKSDTLAQF